LKGILFLKVVEPDLLSFLISTKSFSQTRTTEKLGSAEKLKSSS